MAILLRWETKLPNPTKRTLAWLYYLTKAAIRRLYTQDQQRLNSRKIFERKEIAKGQQPWKSYIEFTTFKDPCLQDMLGLRGGYLQADL